MENKKQENENRYRPIDSEAKEIVSWWKKKFVFISRVEMKKWKIIFISAFIAGAIIATSTIINFDREQESKASLVPAKLMFSPSSLTTDNGQQFNVDVVMDTAGGNIVAAKAIVKYDTSSLQLLGWNTSESIFSYNNNCVYDYKPCEIVNSDTSSGKIEIVLSKPSPGVSSSSGKIATLTFKSLKFIDNSTNVLSLDFLNQGNYEDSDVIINDGNGTDTLSSVGNFSLNMIAPDISGPVISKGSPSGELSSTTTKVSLSLNTSEKANCKYSKNPNTSYSSMENFFDSRSMTKHSASVSGISAGNSYEYYVKCKDQEGNENYSDYLINFSIAKSLTDDGITSTTSGDKKIPPGQNKQ